MRVDVVTIFPGLFAPFVTTSLVGRAVASGRLTVLVTDLRDFAAGRPGTVDDTPYGGGAGMVLSAPPLLKAVRALAPQGSPALRILLTPQGARLDDALVGELASHPHLVLVCGRYEGVDERVSQLVIDREVSIGDYVLSGGELPAMVLIEALSRHIPGVVGEPRSVEHDSFRAGTLDHPHYTRPSELEGLVVPPVLQRGHHGEIARYRREQALSATLRKRPDLLDRAALSEPERRWLEEQRRLLAAPTLATPRPEEG